jgi:hypothetical protein
MLRNTKPVAAHPMDESRGLRGIFGQGETAGFFVLGRSFSITVNNSDDLLACYVRNFYTSRHSADIFIRIEKWLMTAL